MTRNWKSKYSIYRVLPSGQTRKFQVLVASFKAHFRRRTAGRKRIHLFTSRKLGRLLGNSTFFGGLFTWNHCESNQQSMDDNGCTDPSLHLLIQVSVKFTNNRYPLQKRFATSKITPICRWYTYQELWLSIVTLPEIISIGVGDIRCDIS